ncbi:hypothetical protein A6R68_20211 [Neotoma lepida]|uniref:F-box domain-containing protein n=1 Tax=Neotoma lepida TaxID=56216 RepID=A0A1A6HTK4_NEOLE|nr:hypothetical protein A6R68_20211 [Neotoma lepida]
MARMGKVQVFSNNDDGLINKKLPKELLLRIFSFLDIVTLCRCAQISKAWNILALDGSNWQRIDLFNFQTDVEGRVVENISKRCGGFLRKLSLRGCIGVGDSSLKTFAQNCRNIEHLNLNGCTKITDSTCYSLSRFCSKLKHLDLTSCVDGCRNLEYLNLSWCDQITKEGIEALVRGCRGLKALLLRGCTQLEDEALKHIQNHCHELVSLNLQSCSSLSHCELITDEGILHLSSSTCGHERLRVLELDNCLLVTDAALEHLENCRGLERLELYDCQQVTRAGIKRMRKVLDFGDRRGLSFLMSKSMPTLLQSPLLQQWQEVDIDCVGQHKGQATKAKLAQKGKRALMPTPWPGAGCTSTDVLALMRVLGCGSDNEETCLSYSSLGSKRKQPEGSHFENEEIKSRAQLHLHTIRRLHSKSMRSPTLGATLTHNATYYYNV